jgi:uncharacterized OB-fold protein
MAEVPPLVPVPDARSAPFFDGARAGRLMLQRCARCAAWLHPVRTRCPDCGSGEIEWAAASGRGRLYSWGLLHRAYHPDHARRLPIALAVVDLEEGVRMSASLAGADAGGLRCGMPLEVVFEPLVDGSALPVFRPRRA